VATSSRCTLDAGLRGAGFRGELLAECPLGPYTTWRIGGPAECLATPADRDDLILALRWAAERSVDWRVLGNGSNLLVRDAGVRGLVLRVRKVLEEVSRRGRRLVVGAGASFPAVARRAATWGLSGIEFGAGIPGTVGGAIVMNAGWHEFEIGNVVESVEHLGTDGGVRRYDGDACAFAYRRSVFRGRRGVVLGATLRLEPGEAGEIQARLEQFAESRKANQPTELPSCGSVFLKPEGDFAGRLIEAAGLKGAQVGGVQVSRKHANFFVNVGGATARDVIELVERVERVVEDTFDVRLVREFELW
jgi:UDP-N-acetylmuramate dehydrogenase